MPITFGALKLAHFPHANTPLLTLPCCNQTHTAVIAETIMFLQTSAIVDHTQHALSTEFLASYKNNRKTFILSNVLWFELCLSGNK